jgi:hypothetical protein
VSLVINLNTANVKAGTATAPTKINTLNLSNLNIFFLAFYLFFLSALGDFIHNILVFPSNSYVILFLKKN